VDIAHQELVSFLVLVAIATLRSIVAVGARGVKAAGILKTAADHMDCSDCTVHFSDIIFRFHVSRILYFHGISRS